MRLRPLSIREEAEALVIRALDDGMSPRDLREIVSEYLDHYEEEPK